MLQISIDDSCHRYQYGVWLNTFKLIYRVTLQGTLHGAIIGYNSITFRELKKIRAAKILQKMLHNRHTMYHMLCLAILYT